MNYLPISDINYIQLMEVFDEYDPEHILKELAAMNPLNPNVDAQIEFLLSRPAISSNSKQPPQKQKEVEQKTVVIESTKEPLPQNKRTLKQSELIIPNKRPKAIQDHPIIPANSNNNNNNNSNQVDIKESLVDWIKIRTLSSELKMYDFVRNTKFEYGQIVGIEENVLFRRKYTVCKFQPYISKPTLINTQIGSFGSEWFAVTEDQFMRHLQCFYQIRQKVRPPPDLVLSRHYLQGFSPEQIAYWFEAPLRKHFSSSFYHGQKISAGYCGDAYILGIDKFTQTVSVLKSTNEESASLDPELMMPYKRTNQDLWFGKFGLRLYLCIPDNMLQNIPPDQYPDDLILQSLYGKEEECKNDLKSIHSTFINRHLFFLHGIELVHYQLNGNSRKTDVEFPNDTYFPCKLNVNRFDKSVFVDAGNILPEFQHDGMNEFCQCCNKNRNKNVALNLNILKVHSIQVEKSLHTQSLVPGVTPFEITLTCDILKKMGQDFVDFDYFLEWIVSSIWTNHEFKRWGNRDPESFPILQPIHTTSFNGGKKHDLNPETLMELAQKNPYFLVSNNGIDEKNTKEFTEQGCNIHVPGFELKPYQYQTIEFMNFQESIPSLYNHLFQPPESELGQRYSIRECDRMGHQIKLKEQQQQPQQQPSEYKINLGHENVTPPPQVNCSGGCLALEMRLGKTVIILSYIQHIIQLKRKTGPTLILASVNCIAFFLLEIKKLFPNLVFCNVDDAQTKKKIQSAEGVTFLQSMDVVLCQWSLLTSLGAGSNFYQVKYDRLVIDEAQEFFAHTSKSFQMLYEIQRKHVWLLTGTPFQANNRICELGPLFNACWGPILSKADYKLLNTMDRLEHYNRTLLRFLRFVQAAVLVISHQDVGSSTSERKHFGILHEIDVSQHKQFKQKYQQLLNLAPTSNSLQKSKDLGTAKFAFINRLRSFCSSFLDVDAVINKQSSSNNNNNNNNNDVVSDDDDVKIPFLPPNTVIFSGNQSKENEYASKNDDCVICTDTLASPFMLPCHHVLCATCVVDALQRLNNVVGCPMRCGSTKDKNGITIPSKYTRSQMKKVMWQEDYDAMVARINESKSETITTEEFSLKDHPKMNYLASLMIEWDNKRSSSSSSCTARARARAIRNNNNNNNNNNNEEKTNTNPDDKILIFSDIKSTQLAIQVMLENMPQFQNRVLRLDSAMTAKNRIKLFANFTSSSSPYDILILPVITATMGIEMSCASEAICVEPFVDPARNLQAINRLYHILKDKTMLIHYLMIKNTVEESIVHEIPIPFLKEIRNNTIVKQVEEEKKYEIKNVSVEEFNKIKNKSLKTPLKLNQYANIFQREMQSQRKEKMHLYE